MDTNVTKTTRRVGAFNTVTTFFPAQFSATYADGRYTVKVNNRMVYYGADAETALAYVKRCGPRNRYGVVPHSEVAKSHVI